MALDALEIDAIEDVYEPYLLQLGFINKTPRGRMTTQLVHEHLGIRTKSDRNVQE